MQPTVESLGIHLLSRDARIALVQEIWATIAAEPYEPVVSDAQRQELERRLAEDDAHPEDTVPWDEAKAQTLRRLKS